MYIVYLLSWIVLIEYYKTDRLDNVCNNLIFLFLRYVHCRIHFNALQYIDVK